MNTSFANQLVGFILLNGSFEYDSYSPDRSNFAVDLEGCYMRLWFAREGWMHLTITFGAYDDGVVYHYVATQYHVFDKVDFSFHQTLDSVTPTQWNDYECHRIYSEFDRKSYQC